MILGLEKIGRSRLMQWTVIVGMALAFVSCSQTADDVADSDLFFIVHTSGLSLTDYYERCPDGSTALSDVQHLTVLGRVFDLSVQHSVVRSAYLDPGSGRVYLLSMGSFGFYVSEFCADATARVMADFNELNDVSVVGSAELEVMREGLDCRITVRYGVPGPNGERSSMSTVVRDAELYGHCERF